MSHINHHRKLVYLSSYRGGCPWLSRDARFVTIVLIFLVIPWTSNLLMHATSEEVEPSIPLKRDILDQVASSTVAIPRLPSSTSHISRLRVRYDQPQHRQEQQVLVPGAPPMNNSAIIQGVRPFKSLTCNSEIFKLSGAPPCTTTWTSLFGTSDTFNNRVVIPCGRCVVMNSVDINNGSKKLNLLGGIDIQGKLVIPDNGQPLNITTTTIIVQGQLIISATKPIDGVPTIRIRMVGTDNTLSYTPIDVNTNACKGQTTCTAGKKSIVVAGGRLNLNGVPDWTPSWTPLYDARGGASFQNPDTIIVAKSTMNRWNVGSEIVLTSHTHAWDTHQVRKIIQRVSVGLENYVGYKLNVPFLRPTTMLESRDFAVEVALLSRNIVFEGATDDTNVRHGGHLVIFHTPSIVQRIVGVEFKNFGQQGILGRYPIHFHHCHDVTGSLVSKNVIRQSKQRCISIHGTNSVSIQGNVAYDTKGHCYYTEDGTETGNEFLWNIGIQTGPVDVLIQSIPSANNGIETDDQPSTFWITNPSNTWIGNVAAGSQNSGFWFDPKLRGPKAIFYNTRFYKPDTIQLVEFKNNVAHSISTIRTEPKGPTSVAFRMYTPGYLPTKLATLDGIRSYKNAVGINIHSCHKLLLTNSIFADNFRNIELERSEDLRVTNTVVIGESASYKQLMARQNVGTVCLRQKLIGIQLGTWQNKIGPGYTLSNVTLIGFKDASCLTPAMISYTDLTLKQGILETTTTFGKVQVPEGVTNIDMCLINQGPFDMLYINDLNGNFHPTNNGNGVTGTLVASDNNVLLKFITPMSKCTTVSAGCYSYCRDTCFRTLRVEVSGTLQSTWQLKVCVRGSIPQVCVFYKAGRRADTGPHTIMAHVPTGQLYDAWIVNSLGQTVRPNQQVAYYDSNQCGTGRRFDIALSGQVGTIPFTPWSV